MPEQVTVGQVAQQAIERLQGRINELEEAARELLSYCEVEADEWPEDVILTPGDAYRDVTGKLRTMLAGER